MPSSGFITAPAPATFDPMAMPLSEVNKNIHMKHIINEMKTQPDKPAQGFDYLAF